ncbi:hypothetical protein [Actinopolymorpha pittospori]|uniref:hypothetical protein n=1 Tax=Actinopolymorpha pittospori TaxID=648752 RepID=UPI0031EA8B9A
MSARVGEVDVDAGESVSGLTGGATAPYWCRSWITTDRTKFWQTGQLTSLAATALSSRSVVKSSQISLCGLAYFGLTDGWTGSGVPLGVRAGVLGCAAASVHVKVRAVVAVGGESVDGEQGRRSVSGGHRDDGAGAPTGTRRWLYVSPLAPESAGSNVSLTTTGGSGAAVAGGAATAWPVRTGDVASRTTESEADIARRLIPRAST